MSQPEPQSWGEAIRQYQARKQAAPVRQSSQETQSLREPTNNRMFASRNFDIISGMWKTPELEKVALEKAKSAQVARLQRSKKVNLSHASHWESIQHRTDQSSTTALSETAQIRSKKQLKADVEARHFDIISNQQLWSRPATPVEDVDNNSGIRGPAGARPRAALGLRRNILPPRDFDVISNKALTVEGQAQEALVAKGKRLAEQREIAQDAFWRLNHYDPVRARFYHPDEEARFRRQRDDMQRRHGHRRLAKLPLGMKNSDSMAYDIIQHKVYDQAHIDRRLAKEAKLRSRNTYTLEREQLIHQAVDAALEEDAARRLHSVNHRRFLEQAERGYNIINCQGFKGDRGRPLAPPHTRPRITPWQHLDLDFQKRTGRLQSLSTSQRRQSGRSTGGASAPSLAAAAAAAASSSAGTAGKTKMAVPDFPTQ